MLDDVARTAAYRVALEQNPSCVKGKRVLDIGCGTGILSMFAARGGAAKVVGVDGAAEIAAVARANAAHNGFGDVITIVQGKVEELLRADASSAAPEGSETLQKHSFDVLVSEWMGYALLFESMFDTVIEARDFLLKPGGAILPDVAVLHVAGFGRNATSLPFWDDVYGFEMPCVQKSLAEDAIKAAIVAPVRGAHVVTDSREIRRLDLATVAAKDLDFTAAEVVLAARTDGVRGDEVDASVTAGAGEGATGLTQRSVVLDTDAGGPVMVHGVVLWFDTLFSERFSAETPGALSTSPHERQTHWAQTMLHFPEPIALNPPGGCETARGDETRRDSGALGARSNPCASIRVRVGMAKCAEEERVRGLDVSLEYVAVGAGGEEGERKARMYRV
jgi:protein arginine N-methyltransferase 3